jgi:hypothetical protein
LQFVEGLAAKAQQVRIRFQTGLGEYFLDNPTHPTIGFPYLQIGQSKITDQRVIVSAARTVLSNLGLTSVSVDLQYDKSERRMTIAWQATDDSGEELSGSV